MEKAFLHGGDYNPEQWLDYEGILEKDIELFKKAGINTVSLGMFSWSVLEPREGEYNFSYLEKIVDRLYENGISTILSTPSGARPKWLSDKYEEVLRVRSDKRRNFFGERHNHCYNSPVYRQKISAINERLSKIFGNKESVILWHISNEYGGECHCDICVGKFRMWLQDKYKSIDKLNKAWNTVFWSHVYNDFSQIESPGEYGESLLHGLNLDWKRFVTYSSLDFMKTEVEAVRKYSSKPVTTNFMYDYKGLDYKKFKDTCDIVSWDNYPGWGKKSTYETSMDSGFAHDCIRGIKKEPFLLMESSPGATNWQSVSKLRRPGILKLQSFQAVAHGSDSVLYFQLRQSLGTSEKFHAAVIDHYGESDTRIFFEVSEVGRLLEEIKQTFASNIKSEVAIVYDRENDWAMSDSCGPRNKGLYYREQVLKHYKGVKAMGVNIDIISYDDDLSGYKLLILPMVYMLPEAFSCRIAHFCATGGKAVLTYFSSLVDENDLCYMGRTPHGLDEVFGLRTAELDALYDEDFNEIIPVKDMDEEFPVFKAMKDKSYICKNFCELIKAENAKAIFEFKNDFYAGFPALTYKSYEKGESFFIAADFEEAFYFDFYRSLILSTDIAFIEDLNPHIEVNKRYTDKYSYLFVANTAKESLDFKAPKGYEVIYGEDKDRIEALECRIYRKE